MLYDEVNLGRFVEGLRNNGDSPLLDPEDRLFLRYEDICTNPIRVRDIGKPIILVRKGPEAYRGYVFDIDIQGGKSGINPNLSSVHISVCKPKKEGEKPMQLYRLNPFNPHKRVWFKDVLFYSVAATRLEARDFKEEIGRLLRLKKELELRVTEDNLLEGPFEGLLPIIYLEDEPDESHFPRFP